jgi:hypothetical protein
MQTVRGDHRIEHPAVRNRYRQASIFQDEIIVLEILCNFE